MNKNAYGGTKLQCMVKAVPHKTRKERIHKKMSQNQNQQQNKNQQQNQQQNKNQQQNQQQNKNQQEREQQR